MSGAGPGVSGGTTENGPRRFLIATAVSHYPHAPEWDRPGLVDARRQVVELFTGKLGYAHVSDLGANPTQQQLLWELREFCRSPDRRPDDIVAVYIAGHGELLGNDDYVLLTSDTNPEDLYDALQPSTLARKILAGTKVRRLLLMLDTCFSGQGGNELLTQMAKLKNQWREEGAGLAVITSAQPNELAQTGAFPQLLAEAVDNLATAGYTPPLLALDAVVNATRANPKRPDFQHIGLEIIGLTGEIPPFLPNSRHSPGLSHTDMALQQAAEWDQQDQRRDVEFRTRLLRRAMGHRDEARVGWWFSGRHRALKDITRWLGELPHEEPALVVTGDPGSGKTAVLGLLAAVSDREYRRTVPLATLGLTSERLPPPEAIRTAVYAQNLTDQQVVRALAAALRLPSAETVADLLNHLNSRPEPERPHVVLIDGLDEAATPPALCGQVLRPLMELAGTHLRLLLGTRPHLLAPLGLDRGEHIDLDAPRYADRQAVLAYTVRNLMDGHPDSPYLECPNEDRMAVARAVARAAGRSFLVARITAGTLAAVPELPDSRDPAWRRSLPRAAAEAMHGDLHQRFGDDHAARIMGLLRPLAYAEGQGLPWEDIWAPLASEIAGRRHTNQDLHRLRREAGAYVVEAVEDGRSVYRLYHEAMAEYLRQGQDARAAHRAVTKSLRAAVPYGLDGTPDWERAHPYALRHLATHAAAGGALDSLLADPEYLVHADCDTLALHLPEAGSDTARLHAAIYLVSLHLHRDLDAAGRRQILAMNAARFNEPGTVEALNSRMGDGDWRPLAASGSQVSGSVRHVFTGHTEAVDTVACAELDGRPIAVSASRDHSVRVWDLTTGRPVGEPLTGHTGVVYAVDCTVLDGRPIAVTGSWDNTVRIWDLAAGRALGDPLTGHTAHVEHVACTELAGRPVAVTGSNDNSVRVWDLATGRPVGEPTDVGSPVNALACAVLDGGPVAVAQTTRGGPRVWDLASRSERGRLEGGEHLWVGVMACTELDGLPVVVGCDGDETMHIWDLATRRHLAEWRGPGDWTYSLTCAEVDGRRVAITGSGDARVRLWDLLDHREVGAPLLGHSSGVRSVACTALSGQPVVVSGSFDGTVRVWDLAARRAVGRPVIGHTNDVTGMDLAVLDGREVFVTAAADNTVRVWDLATALPVGEPVHDHEGDDPVGRQPLSCSVLGGRPVAVTVGRGDTGRVWDIETGRAACPPIELGTLAAMSQVACAVVDGDPVAVFATLDDRVRVVDLTTGADRYPPLEGHASAATVTACTELDGRPVAVTGSHDATFRVWDLATGRPVGGAIQGYGEGVMACAVLDDGPVIVAGWNRDPMLRMFSLSTGRPVGQPMTGHTQPVSALVCGELDGRPVAVSGSPDNTVRVWDLRTCSSVGLIHVPGECAALALSASGLLACSMGSDVAVLGRTGGGTIPR
ncbi:caspase family protein [Streptomyces sp. NBC_00414]|uniref:AAA family ATPase n=1 Tax=Streptomyces sp. NBC_00414 TaxID=2975739 RepID=UPI002E24D60E